jgi:hypothetical protein
MRSGNSKFLNRVRRETTGNVKRTDRTEIWRRVLELNFKGKRPMG